VGPGLPEDEQHFHLGDDFFRVRRPRVERRKDVDAVARLDGPLGQGGGYGEGPEPLGDQ